MFFFSILRNISPVESLPVAIGALGEGWHNYHHVFPWDYKTSEFGDYKYNLSTGFIDFFAKLGWAFDRKWICCCKFSAIIYEFSVFLSQGKTASPEMIARRVAKCGDGSHYLDDKEVHANPVWGVGDKDICEDDWRELEQMRT